MGDVALAASPRQLTAVALISLIALRLAIGFHFFTEGADKLENPRPFSANFLANAKGRLAPFFHGMVWDADGLARLDLEQTKAIWDHFRERLVQNYNFNEEQAKQAEEIFKRRVRQLEAHLDDFETEIEEYKRNLQRRDAYRQQKSRTQVASLRGQIEKIEDELRSKRSDLLDPIEKMWSGYEAELNDIAARSQRPWGPVSISKPGRRVLDSETVDKVIPYFDLALGLLLMIGLFTRVASIAGALFLCSVIASQWPGSPGAIPVWPQFIEALGLVVIAATATGRVAGVDFFLGLLRGWCCPPKQGTES